MAREKAIKITPDAFLSSLNAIIPGWIQEYKFYPGRMCRFDYANPVQLIAIEIEGGMWMSQTGGKSRHFTGSGASKDMSKYNAAERLGWTIFRYADNGKALKQSTVFTALRDVRAVITGIDISGQITLEMTTITTT